MGSRRHRRDSTVQPNQIECRSKNNDLARKIEEILRGATRHLNFSPSARNSAFMKDEVERLYETLLVLRCQTDDEAADDPAKASRHVTGALAVLTMAALATVFLVLASRRATLRQVNASLLEISEQVRLLRKPCGVR